MEVWRVCTVPGWHQLPNQCTHQRHPYNLEAEGGVANCLHVPLSQLSLSVKLLNASAFVLSQKSMVIWEKKKQIRQRNSQEATVAIQGAGPRPGQHGMERAGEIPNSIRTYKVQNLEINEI